MYVLCDTFADAWYDAFADAWCDSFADAWCDSFADAWCDAFADAWYDAFAQAWYDAFAQAWCDAFAYNVGAPARRNETKPISQLGGGGSGWVVEGEGVGGGVMKTQNRPYLGPQAVSDGDNATVF